MWKLFKPSSTVIPREKLWLQAQKNGIEIINSRYLRTLFEADFNSNIERLLTDLKQHRLYNFIGELLQYHTLRNTKYMSKWIEERINVTFLSSMLIQNYFAKENKLDFIFIEQLRLLQFQ
jgi:hypothetical protein